MIYLIMFYDLLNYEILNWFISNGSNLGNLLLGGVALYGSISYCVFRKQERIKKRSDIAEKSLNYLDIFNDEFLAWIYFSSTFKDEFINYEKGSLIRKDLYKSKNLSLRLQNSHLNKQFYELNKAAGNAISAIYMQLRQTDNSEKQQRALNREDAIKNLEIYYNNIHKILCDYLHMN